tara:strand:+ start:3508 stop:3807 length:300 start_codon:yes stop_codon:yes gene_type:complete
MSIFANAEFRIAIENGVQIKVCPNITVQRFRDKPSCIRTTSKETPTIISGKKSGRIKKDNILFLAKKTYRDDARDASIPKHVLRIEVLIATNSEFFNDS